MLERLRYSQETGFGGTLKATSTSGEHWRSFMECPVCERPSPDNAKFCSFCGNSLVDSPPGGYRQLLQQGGLEPPDLPYQQQSTDPPQPSVIPYQSPPAQPNTSDAVPKNHSSLAQRAVDQGFQPIEGIHYLQICPQSQPIKQLTPISMCDSVACSHIWATWRFRNQCPCCRSKSLA